MENVFAKINLLTANLISVVLKPDLFNERITANTIDQIRTHLMYLKQTDLLKNKDILMCLDVVAREYGGEVVDKN